MQDVVWIIYVHFIYHIDMLLYLLCNFCGTYFMTMIISCDIAAGERVVVVLWFASPFTNSIQLVSITDLESDALNPRDMAYRVNIIVPIEYIIHGVHTLSFLVFGYWLELILNLPIAAFHANLYDNAHILSPQRVPSLRHWFSLIRNVTQILYWQDVRRWDESIARWLYYQAEENPYY